MSAPSFGLAAGLEVLKERHLQVVEHGHSHEADDAKPAGALLAKARAKVATCLMAGRLGMPSLDPAVRRTQLVRAAALIIAEIERGDRLDAEELSRLAPTASVQP